LNRAKEHIVFKSVIIILIIALLVPSFVKFAHVFENHKHEVCKNPQNTHFHEVDLDCEFYLFKLNPQSPFVPEYFKIDGVLDDFKPIISQYYFVSDHQRLSFTLRGPPSLV